MGKTRRHRSTAQTLPIVSQELKRISFAEMMADWESSSQKNEQPVRLETDPVTHVITDWEKPQRYFEAITDAHLWWVREMQLRSFEPWAKFWFQNRVTGEIVYTLMSNIYKARYTPLNTLINDVVSTPSTVKDYLTDAEDFDLVSMARDVNDKRRVLVRVTRRTLISYENQMIIQQAMELAIRLKYAAHMASGERRSLFRQWSDMMEKRRKITSYSNDFDTINTAGALRRLNLEFDEEFYPKFVGKNLQNFTDEFS